MQRTQLEERIRLFIRTHQMGRGLMAVSKAQLRTLRLLNKEPAHRVYRSTRPGDYKWVHEDTHVSLTPTLHRLFTSGYATVSSDNSDMAVITEKGRAIVS
jgi:hypothetical protein